MYATPDNMVRRLIRQDQRRMTITFKRKVVDNDKERLCRNRGSVAKN